MEWILVAMVAATYALTDWQWERTTRRRTHAKTAIAAIKSQLLARQEAESVRATAQLQLYELNALLVMNGVPEIGSVEDLHRYLASQPDRAQDLHVLQTSPHESGWWPIVVLLQERAQHKPNRGPRHHDREEVLAESHEDLSV